MSKLTELEQKVFKAWEGVDVGYGFNFEHVSRRSGVEFHKIRRVVRSIARKGLVAFCRNAWTDEGELYGACYVLTEAGRAALKEQSNG